MGCAAFNLRRRLVGITLVLTSVLAAGRSAAVEGETIDFLRDVRPILVKSCLACHGGVRKKGKLSLVSADHALKRAEPVLTPGKPEESEFYRRIISDDPEERMPADGKALEAHEVQIIRRWIEQGANWEGHWAFGPIRRPAAPTVANEAWVRNPIDRFVLAKLEGKGVAPSGEAPRAVLIRRLSLDLVGLPPTAEELNAFLADEGNDAYERLVNRLLASPHFGERWGRHWLDLARYADTDGYEVDGERPNAWHWRDWVIKAVNDDVPFDRFTIEQLAGDLLPEPTEDQQLATAFHRQTLTNKEGGIDQEEYRTYAVMDRVSTTGGVWLGLTMGCAQCHDHPYDPVTQREYYALFAFFNDADEGVLARGATAEQKEKYQRELDRLTPELAALRKALFVAVDEEKPEIEKQIKALERQMPRAPGVKLDVMRQRPAPRETFVLDRGDFQQPKKDQPVEPGVPGALNLFTASTAATRADRLDLARWVVDPANPLTRRVEVNRIWQQLFGTGLVSTPDDFGMSGEPPTHPELLDWLAEEFLSRGWSRKEMIRLIVTSATYRQSSRHRPELAQIDPRNELLHRQNRLRVEAEIVRDLNLAVSGLLARKVGGRSVFPPIPEDLAKIDFRSDLKWIVSKGEDRYRRGMYTFFKRTLPDPNLTMFDCPDAMTASFIRQRSNTPLQALARLNNPVFVEAQQALGARLAKMEAPDAERMAELFRICVSRPPSSVETEEMLTLLRTTQEHLRLKPDEARALIGSHVPEGVMPDRAAAWVTVTGVVLNLDEFITRE